MTAPVLVDAVFSTSVPEPASVKPLLPLMTDPIVLVLLLKITPSLPPNASVPPLIAVLPFMISPAGLVSSPSVSVCPVAVIVLPFCKLSE